MYQLTRPAANRSSYSDRMAKIGKPHDTLSSALSAARKRGGATITDLNTGLWGTVSRIMYANGPHAGTEHVVLSFPEQWANMLITTDSIRPIR